MKEVKKQEVKKPNKIKRVIINDNIFLLEKPKKIRIEFGPHHYLEITQNKETVFLEIGATHHGIKLEANTTNSHLEKCINLLRDKYPSNVTD